MTMAPARAGARPGKPTIWLRRLADPIEVELVRDNEHTVRLLDPDDNGRPLWREIAGPTPAGDEPRYVEHDAEPLPDPLALPYELWRRDQLYALAQERELDLRPLEQRPTWGRKDLIALLIAGEAKAQKDQAKRRADAAVLAPSPTDDYPDLSREELLNLCEERAIEVAPRTPKPALVAKLREHDRKAA